ncbi:hypothetical protein [Anabaena lutea]|uniref:Uncharacterized protein n=1 Tax=Anabaena lutea FACHB-196 TaxID=2692881 RepID=A0ABR8F955_9NOST|nr:hypothetical protein [Anabaena lutea]MBD2566415.1 hypothetical protein [Anabaena lutea FACHB-196]
MSGVIKLTKQVKINGEMTNEIKGVDLAGVEALDADKNVVEDYWDGEQVVGFRFTFNNNTDMILHKSSIDPDSEEFLLDALDTM